MSSNVSVDIQQAKKLATHAIECGIVPMLHGSPGCGKTAIFREIAKEFNLKPIELHLTSREPTDLNGLPAKSAENRLTFLAPEDIPLAHDKLPEGYDGWLLLLDELPNAHPAVLKAVYKLILDKKIGEHDVHPECFIAAAGNLSTDNAMVGKLPTPLKRRMVHLEVRSDVKAFLDYAVTVGLDYRVISYVNWKPEVVTSFDPKTTDNTFACPATLEMLSTLIEGENNLQPLVPLISGSIGNARGVEFYTFTKIISQLPSYADIINDPVYVNIPDDMGTRYALCGMIAEHAKPKDANNLMKFIERMPKDFQGLLLRWICKKDKAWAKQPVIDAWVTKNYHIFRV